MSGDGWACRTAVDASAALSQGTSDAAAMSLGCRSTSSTLRIQHAQRIRPSADFDRYVDPPPQRGGVPNRTEPLAVDCRPARAPRTRPPRALETGIGQRTGGGGVTLGVTPPAVIGRTRTDWPRLPQEGTGPDGTRPDARREFLNLVRVFGSPRGYEITSPPQEERARAVVTIRIPISPGRPGESGVYGLHGRSGQSPGRFGEVVRYDGAGGLLHGYGRAAS
jgi:hypothetical protein